MIIAFDFDGICDNYAIQKLIIKLRKEKNEVWIITARRKNDFNIKYMAGNLSKCRITEANVIYADGKKKRELIEAINADIYIDNISDELAEINNYSETVGLLFVK